MKETLEDTNSETMDAGTTIPRDLHEQLFAQLEGRKFFGVIESHIENGKIVRLKSRQTFLKQDVKELIQAE